VPSSNCSAQIAEALEPSPEITESQPELLAQHHAEAGLAARGCGFLGKAGHRSRSEMAEAATQFRKGLDQLALLPDISEKSGNFLAHRACRRELGRPGDGARPMLARESRGNSSVHARSSFSFPAGSPAITAELDRQRGLLGKAIPPRGCIAKPSAASRNPSCGRCAPQRGLPDQDRRAAAGLLVPGYGWLAEGFATADLTGPKALLDGPA
jgi:hypothetical protein